MTDRPVDFAPDVIVIWSWYNWRTEEFDRTLPGIWCSVTSTRRDKVWIPAPTEWGRARSLEFARWCQQVARVVSGRDHDPRLWTFPHDDVPAMLAARSGLYLVLETHLHSPIFLRPCRECGSGALRVVVKETPGPTILCDGCGGMFEPAINARTYK